MWETIPANLSPENKMMLIDSLTYLPDDILCKVDRAAMGVSLETRAPFLDHRLADFAWQLPMKYKIRDGQNKWILRQILYKYIPKDLSINTSEYMLKYINEEVYNTNKKEIK